MDAGILQLLVIHVDANPYVARIASFLIAASGTWLLNRYFTFRVKHQATRKEWLRYLGFMLLGATVNYGIYAFFIFIKEQPWLAVAGGSIAALGINFTMSRLIFRQTTSVRE